MPARAPSAVELRLRPRQPVGCGWPQGNLCGGPWLWMLGWPPEARKVTPCSCAVFRPPLPRWLPRLFALRWQTGRSGLQNRRFRMVIWAVLPPGAQGADCQMVGLGVWVGLCRGRMPAVTTDAGAACGGGQTAHGYMAIPPSGKHSGRRDCLSARHVAAVPCRIGSLIASRPSARV